MEQKKNSKGFWLIFIVIIVLAAIATIGNLSEFNKMNRLNTEGKRILCPVDSVSDKGGKQEIFVSFSVNGKAYRASKKVKTHIARGDSVSVYYLEDDPANNGIVAE